MKALICQVSNQNYYMGEDDKKGIGYANFINFNGMYYGHFESQNLEKIVTCHHMEIPYVIFVSKNTVVGWYKNATVYQDEQYYGKDCPFYCTCKDSDAFLLEAKDRSFRMRASSKPQLVDIDRRLHAVLKQSRRINYHHTDLNKTSIVNLKDLQSTCQCIEQEMVNHQYLDALYLVNKAMGSFGNLPSLIYYKAWVLYSLLQYKESSYLLFKIRQIPQFSDFAYYMPGNIYFETGEYNVAISMFNQVKEQNKDSTCYMLAQSYAMIYEVDKAKECINNAISYNDQQPAYQDFLKHLEEWEHEKIS